MTNNSSIRHALVVLVMTVTTFLLSLRSNAVAFQAATKLATRRPSPTAIVATTTSTTTKLVDGLALWAERQRLTNQDLVERRISVRRAKRAVRETTIQQRNDKNYRIKNLLQQQIEGQDKIPGAELSSPSLYAVKVWVDDALRQELRLSGREKRGRVFIEKGIISDENSKSSDATTTLKGLKSELHSFFRALRKNTFLLTASLPKLAPDGTISSERPEEFWTIESDEDVIKTFAKADEFFQSHTSSEGSQLTRPSIQINVLKDPNAPPPPPPPEYLKDMADPNETKTMTMISFYSFPPSGIEDPEAFALDLRRKWKPFNALGRVYVAEEGVNAQMSIPTNVLESFMNCCRSIPELGEHMENDINIDPKPLSLEEFAVAGVPINGKPAPPFRNLHVRVRTQIVADGLDKSLNWQSAGYDMPPLEWHEKLKEARAKRAEGKIDEVPILLDCRNDYETDVGIFDGAEPLGTESFRESWDVLKERLADTPKDAPIMTYCTGGIRCVKVGAYLTQELGFTNVSRLAGGIIAYDRTLNEKTNGEESMFKGTNFVFDGRLGRQITDDALSECITCGAETSLVSNCRNDSCHKRMVQCENCRTSFHGACSDACKNRIVNGAMMPRRLQTSRQETSKEKNYDNLDEYSVGHSSPVPSVYHEMELNTQAFLPSGAHMVSGAVQGRLLTQLASMTRKGRILELGTFTGYATACFLEGAKNAGEATGVTNGNMNNGPYVMTMERDPRAYNLAVAHLKAVAEHGFGDAASEAACAFRNNIPEVEEDIVSLSLDGVAGCDLLRVTDALASVEAIAAGTGSLHPAPFDLVFVDADKTRLLEYVEACLGSDRLLSKGGMIVVDNVLWKGLVLEASSGEFSSVADSASDGDAELRKNRRARKLATQMHRFNAAIVNDDRAEVLVLPLRDGLSVIRKK